MRVLVVVLLIGIAGCGSEEPTAVETGTAKPETTIADSQVNSKLTTCPDCGGKVSKRADQCPHCGAPLKQTKSVDDADKAKPSPAKVAAAEKAAAEKDTQTGQETLTLIGHSESVNSVSFSPDGKRIVSGSFGNTLKVWDAQTGQETLTLLGHSDWVFSVSFSPDGKRIVSGSEDNTLKVWDISSLDTSR
jgi:WD40 repeat protein